jgi:hypothetical protein
MRKILTVTPILALLAAGLIAAAAPAQTAAAPVNSTLPTVSGTAKVGQTLTVSNGTWSGSPTSYSYQWQRCTSSTSCTDITGATNKTYTVTSADSGHTLRAAVTATNADGKATAFSDRTATVTAPNAPTNSLRPVILGDAFVGQRLEVTNGRWNGSPTSFSYQWLQCDPNGSNCTPIFGATGKTYGVGFTDVFSALRADVTAKNADGSATARSDATDMIQPLRPVVVAGNKAPKIRFVSLKRLGTRIYARFSVCDDRAGRVTVFERDAKRTKLAYVRKFAVVPSLCVNATRHWIPAPRFRTHGRYVVTLRAVDKSGATSRFVTRSLVFH